MDVLAIESDELVEVDYQGVGVHPSTQLALDHIYLNPTDAKLWQDQSFTVTVQTYLWT